MKNTKKSKRKECKRKKYDNEEPVTRDEERRMLHKK